MDKDDKSDIVMQLIDEKNLTTVENICQYDPVRPSIPCEWRIANGNKVFFKGVKSFDMRYVTEMSALLCLFQEYCSEVRDGNGKFSSFWKHCNLLYSMVYKKRCRKRDHLQHCGLSERTQTKRETICNSQSKDRNGKEVSSQKRSRDDCRKRNNLQL